MRRSILIVLPPALMLCVLEPAAAQGTLRLQPGTRVRVTLGVVGSKPFVGILDTVRSDTIKLRMSTPGRMAIPLEQVSRLEISRGQQRPTWAKMAPLWMPLAGAGAGAVIGYATSSDDGFFDRGFGAAALGTVGAVVGLVAGVATAISVKRETWDTIPTTPSGSGSTHGPSFYLAPTPHGVAFGLRAAL